MAILNLVWGVGAPFAGALSDKFGVARVAVGGAALYISGLVLMATATGGNQLLVSGALIGLGIAGTGFTAVFGVIARAAPPEKRASALAMTTMGSAVGQFVSLPFVHLILESAGWATSLLIMAGTSAMMVPLALTLAGSKGDETQIVAQTSEQGLGDALSEALQYPSFLLLTAGFFVCGFHLAAIAVHLPAFLVDKGFDPQWGVIALTIVGAANILGTYICGRIGEVMPKRIALTLLYLGRGLVFVGLLYLPLSVTTILIYSFVLGLLWLGTIPLTNGLIMTFFGPRWLSTLYGIVFFSHQIGSFLGAWLGGWFYDKYHSYSMLWWASILVALLAAVLHLPIRERPVPRLALVAAE